VEIQSGSQNTYGRSAGNPVYYSNMNLLLYHYYSQGLKVHAVSPLLKNNVEISSTLSIKAYIETHGKKPTTYKKFSGDFCGYYFGKYQPNMIKDIGKEKLNHIGDAILQVLGYFLQEKNPLGV
jgi:hypothetical protein